MLRGRSTGHACDLFLCEAQHEPIQGRHCPAAGWRVMQQLGGFRMARRPVPANRLGSDRVASSDPSQPLQVTRLFRSYPKEVAFGHNEAGARKCGAPCAMRMSGRAGRRTGGGQGSQQGGVAMRPMTQRRLVVSLAAPPQKKKNGFPV